MDQGWALAVLLALPAPPVEVAAVKPRTIALRPVGRASPSTLAAIAPTIATAFGASVVIGDAMPLPEGAQDSGRGQYLSTALLDVLASARRPEWHRLLGVADVDLYVPDLNFVFGEADSRRGLAVFSLVRLHSSADEEGAALFLRRAATEAIHELGHTYGLGHCRDRRCVMWFSNTLAESDGKGTAFCPAHAAQLAAALGT
jgi:archaemetzincin